LEEKGRDVTETWANILSNAKYRRSVNLKKKMKRGMEVTGKGGKEAGLARRVQFSNA